MALYYINLLQPAYKDTYELGENLLPGVIWICIRYPVGHACGEKESHVHEGSRIWPHYDRMKSILHSSHLHGGGFRGNVYHDAGA